MKVVLFILILLQSLVFANNEIITITNGNNAKNTFSQRVYEWESGNPPSFKCFHSAGATAINIRLGEKSITDKSAWNYFKNVRNVTDYSGEHWMGLSDWLFSYIKNIYKEPSLGYFKDKEVLLSSIKEHINNNEPIIIPLRKYYPEYKKNSIYKEVEKYSHVVGHAITIVGYIKNSNLIAVRDPSIKDNEAKENNINSNYFDYVLSIDLLWNSLQLKDNKKVAQFIYFNVDKNTNFIHNNFNLIDTTLPNMCFSDNYKASNIQRENICKLKNKGWVEDKKNYFPTDTITRAEFVKIILLANNTKVENIKNPSRIFSDVEDSAWYRNYIYTGVKEGFLKGYDDGTVKPNININFAEVSKIVVETFESFCPVPDTSHDWFEPYTNFLKENYSIVHDPKHLITRAEMAVIIAKVKGL